MRTTRLLSMLLSALLTVSALFSCGRDTQTSTRTTAGSESPASTAAQELQPDLPDADYKGAVINFLVRGEAAHPTNFSVEIYAGEMNGEPINDAVYTRNRYIEDEYNVKITETSTEDTIENVRASVLSGDNSYDIVMMRLSRVTTLAREGLLHNLTKVPHINLSQPWWDANAVDNLRMGDGLYFVTGDINIMDNNAIWTAMFNKRLFTDLGLEYPYELVRKGEWTLDVFNEYVKKGGKDLNGDSVMDEFDQYGLITAIENTFPLVLSTGGRVTSTGSDGNIAINADTDRISSTLDKVIEILSNKSVTLLCDDYAGKYSNPYGEVMRASFREGRGLLYISGILSSTYMRDMEDDFGIIPLPKADAGQQGYHTWMNLNNCSTLCIPSGNDRLEMTGLIAEAMSAKSRYTLTPAYYEVTLSGKVARDEDSVEMLDIILSSVVFDFGNIYNIGGINGVFDKIIKGSTNTFASDFSSIEGKMESDLEKIRADIEKMG